MEYTKKTDKNIININESLSPRTGRKGSNPYKKMNNRATNSKYLSSGTKRLKNKIKDYTLDSENNKVLFYSEEENKNYHNLANEIRIQNKILEEYESWVKTFLSIINNNKVNNENNIYDDIGSPIQQNLEHIEKLKEENFKIKTLIINQKIKNENSEKKLEKKQLTQNSVIKEFNEKDNLFKKKIKNEKIQLSENVQMLANELDDLSEYNKQLNDKIMKDEKFKKVYELVNLRNQLKKENKLYKKIMVFKNRKNYVDLKGNSQSNDLTIDLYDKKFHKNIFKNINTNNNNREFSSLGPITGYGEYKLEKEENIHTTGSFFCGL